MRAESACVFDHTHEALLVSFLVSLMMTSLLRLLLVSLVVRALENIKIHGLRRL